MTKTGLHCLIKFITIGVVNFFPGFLCDTLSPTITLPTTKLRQTNANFLQNNTSFLCILLFFHLVMKRKRNLSSENDILSLLLLPRETYYKIQLIQPWRRQKMPIDATFFLWKQKKTLDKVYSWKISCCFSSIYWRVVAISCLPSEVEQIGLIVRNNSNEMKRANALLGNNQQGIWPTLQVQGCF